MAPISEKKQAHAMILHFKCWFYVDPKKLTEHNCSLATYLRPKIPSSPSWEVVPIQDWEVAKSKDDKVFVPLEVEVKTTRCCSGDQQKTHLTLFEELWESLIAAVRRPSFKTIVGLNEATHLICYSLWDPKRSKGDKLSRWMLPVPAEPITLPAERVEQALYNLVSVKLRRKDDTHKKCHGAAALECIENLLYQQKLKYDELVRCMNELTEAGDGDIKTIKTCVQTIEGLDKALSTISSLLWQHVGKAVPPTDRWKIICLLKKLFMRQMAAIPIEDEAIESLKKSVRRELAAFQRVTPLMVAHLRLRNSTHWTTLKDVFDKTESGPEKFEMPNKMAIEPEKLSQAQVRKSNFALVRSTYEGDYGKVLAQIEAMTKACGRAYVAGDVNTILGKKSRAGKKHWWSRKKPVKHCKCNGVAKEAVVAKAVEDVLNEKY